MGPPVENMGPVMSQGSVSTAIVPFTETTQDTEMIERTPHGPTMPVERDPDTADTKVRELKEIFSETPDDVLKVALRHCNWIIDRAVDELLNEDSKSRFTQEAMERRKQDQNKSKPAQELSPN